MWKLTPSWHTFFLSVKEFFLGVHLGLKFMDNLFDKRWKEFYCPSDNRYVSWFLRKCTKFYKKVNIYICKKSLRKHCNCSRYTLESERPELIMAVQSVFRWFKSSVCPSDGAFFESVVMCWCSTSSVCLGAWSTQCLAAEEVVAVSLHPPHTTFGSAIPAWPPHHAAHCSIVPLRSCSSSHPSNVCTDSRTARRWTQMET